MNLSFVFRSKLGLRDWGFLDYGTAAQKERAVFHLLSLVNLLLDSTVLGPPPLGIPILPESKVIFQGYRRSRVLGL